MPVVWRNIQSQHVILPTGAVTFYPLFLFPRKGTNNISTHNQHLHRHACKDIHKNLLIWAHTVSCCICCHDPSHIFCFVFLSEAHLEAGRHVSASFCNSPRYHRRRCELPHLHLHTPGLGLSTPLLANPLWSQWITLYPTPCLTVCFWVYIPSTYASSYRVSVEIHPDWTVVYMQKPLHLNPQHLSAHTVYSKP